MIVKMYKELIHLSDKTLNIHKVNLFLIDFYL